jgi:hypothetical protein
MAFSDMAIAQNGKRNWIFHLGKCTRVEGESDRVSGFCLSEKRK